MTLSEAIERLEILVFQRENNAVVPVDLEDCKAIKIVIREIAARA